MIDELKNLVSELRDYYAVRKNIVKLKTAENLSETTSNAIAYTVLAIIGLFVLLFFSVTLALGLGWALGNNFWGFLIVTGLYVAAGAFIYLRKEQVIRIPILNAILKSLFKGERLTDGTSERNRAA